MPAAPIPWEPSNVPTELQDELDRRRRNISLDFVKSEGSWKGGDWQKYKGPMTAWIRVCSNGRGRATFTNTAGEEKDFLAKRFVFFGGKDYQSIFGLKNTSVSPNSQIIGYMPNDKSTPHIIENERTAEYPIHVPAPEISRVEMTIQKEVLRRAVIEWTCFSWKQLEYMTPYFLVPGITVMVEMGWNHFNPESLVNITNEQLMKKLWDNPYPLYEKNIIDSKGNYDVIYGMVTNFNWSVEGNNRYICTTEITSKNRLYAGLPIDSEMIDRKEEEENEELKTLGNLSDFLNTSNTIMNFRQLARYGPDKFINAVKEEVSSLSKDKDKTSIKPGIIPSSVPVFIFSTVLRTFFEKEKLSQKTTYDVSATFQSFFENLVSDIESSQLSNDNKKLRMSYLYGVFDGRSRNLKEKEDKEKTPNKHDFDNSESDSNVWFNMGLISLIINYFSARWSVSNRNPLLELDIDDVIIGAHRNLISTDGGVLLIPNAEAPKYFVGRRGRMNAINSEDEEWLNQVVLGIPFNENNKVEDKLLKRLFYFEDKIARDNHDLIINRYTYRLIPGAKDEEALATMGSRSFPSRREDDKTIHGYLRDLYLNVNVFIRLVKQSTTFYDLINKILNIISYTGADFWDLRPVDNQKGKIGVVDYNYVGRNANLIANNKVLSFDMHDVNNMVKSFKFRPQLSDAQTTRALYGQVANPATQFYSKEEKEDMEWSFKDALMQNTVEEGGDTVLSKRKRLEEWLSILSYLQLINISNDDYQMKLNWNSYTDRRMLDREITRESNLRGKYVYVKLALPSGVGRSILRKMLNDSNFEENQKYCAIQPNINAEITLQGIGGLRTFQCFLIKNLPRPYSEDRILFQIVNVMDHIEAGNWETTIVAGIRPLRKFIADKLGITNFYKTK